MSVRKSRFITKILTGLVTTIVAPVLASVVSQQVDGWQQTLKILVENEMPAAKADWSQPNTGGRATTLQAGASVKPTAPLPVITAPMEKAGEGRRVPSWGR
jgi:hypothetical protein